uniref:Uncharacterized protein n=1 Tax=Physcomitrium patens TaxID=3218 RepID=A9RD50_PHYPA|nr:hypothetical protein PHYPA_010595 [Physcomitrium patens]
MSQIWSIFGVKDSLVAKPAAAKVEQGFQNRLERQLAAWGWYSSWIDEILILEVTVPKEALCKFDSRFELGIPPDAVYNILTDLSNKRVIKKNIEEVKYRKVLQDDGHHGLWDLSNLRVARFCGFLALECLCFGGSG